MTHYTIPESILYSAESRAELAELCETLFKEFEPAGAEEIGIFNQMLVAAWMRRRYEHVRAKLYDRKRALEETSPRLPAILESIQHFQKEVEMQKRQFASLRKSLRRLRGNDTVMEGEQIRAYLPAA